MALPMSLCCIMATVAILVPETGLSAEMGILGALLFLIWGSIRVSPVKHMWYSTSLARSPVPVPEWVQEMAARLQDELPQGSIALECVGADPLVRFDIGKRSFYIAQFDEPEFRPVQVRTHPFE